MTPLDQKTKTKPGDHVANETKVVGTSHPRLEGREKVLGQAIYIDDMSVPRMLHGRLLRSPHPHARIVRIDTSAALAFPGVRAVLTAADLPDRRHGPFVADAPILARGVAKHIGEPVAAVAAESLEIAELALELIEVTYEALPSVLDPDAALEPGSPLVHDDVSLFPAVFDIVRGGNVCSKTTIAAGDVEAAFAASDRVFEHTFTTPMVHQAHLEMNGALAEVDAQGRVTVWTTTQSIHLTLMRVAETLDLPMNKVRVIQTRVGGGFGAKVEPTVQPICVALALKTRRPVKMTLTREEELAATRPRHGSKVTIKTGVTNEGSILVRQVRLVYDSGAYADDGPGITGFGGLMSCGPYKVPNYKVESYCVYTNKVATGAYRGFGNPQSAWAGESQLDIIARELGIDPIELRLRNAVTVNDKTVGGQKLTSVGLIETIEKVKDALDWGSPMPEGRGRGVACVHHLSGIMSSSSIVRMLQDGTFHLSVGTADIGQGSDTVLAQIAAEELGVPLEDVLIASRDTDSTPYNWATTASRLTYTAGNAVRRAAEDAKKKLLALAGSVLEVEIEDLIIEDRSVVATDGSGKRLPLADVGAISLWAVHGPIIGTYSWMFEGQPWGEEVAMEGWPFHGMGAYIYGTQGVEVEVDRKTGQVFVVKAVTAHDVGRAINPISVEGQCQGGFVQGLGYGLFEELKVRDGRIVNTSLVDYKIPTALDVPMIDSLIVESMEPTGPFGAKGLGEAPIVPTAPAIANAVADATGVRIFDLPLSAERVLAALDEQGQA